MRAGTTRPRRSLPAQRRPAVFVLNDQMVGGVVQSLQDHGLTVPGDVDVVSYGNTAINSILRPTVTSFAVPVEQMSFECARTLHQASRHPEALDKLGRVFDAEMVVRQSSPAVADAASTRPSAVLRRVGPVTVRVPPGVVAPPSIWSRGFVHVFAINLIINLSQFMMNTLIPKLAVELGASAVMVGVISGLFAVTALSVRPAVGPATMRVRKNMLLAATIGVMLLASVVYAHADSCP